MAESRCNPKARASVDMPVARWPAPKRSRKQAERERRRKSLERQLVELREQFEAEDAVIEADIQESTLRRERLSAGRMAMGESRRAFASAGKDGQAKKDRRP
jgi:hypothetical protein